MKKTRNQLLQMEMRNKNFISISLLGALFALPLFSFAAVFYAQESVHISSYIPSEGNIYALGTTVSVSTMIEGDVIAAAEEITLSETITQDVALVAGTVTIAGAVDGDARIAAGDIRLSAPVAGDTLLFGNDVRLEQGFVGEDVRVLAGRVVYSGVAKGDSWFFADTVELNGRFEGNVVIDEASHVIVGDTAEIIGDLIYESSNEANVSGDALIVGDIEFTQKELHFTEETMETIGVVLEWIFGAVSAVVYAVTAALFVGLLPRFSERAVGYVLRTGAPAALHGLFGWLVIFFGSIVLMLTIVGFMVGFGLFLAGIVLGMVAKVLTAALVGTMLAQWIYKKTIVSWKWTLAGVLVLELLYLVPILGWLVSMMLFLAVFGSLLRGMYDHWWLTRRT